MSGIDYDELDRRFTAHKVDADSVTCMEDVRGQGRALALAVLRVVPEGREQAVALTKIEEAVFWANAGIAREGGSE